MMHKKSVKLKSDDLCKKTDINTNNQYTLYVQDRGSEDRDGGYGSLPMSLRKDRDSIIRVCLYVCVKGALRTKDGRQMSLDIGIQVPSSKIVYSILIGYSLLKTIYQLNFYQVQ